MKSRWDLLAAVLDLKESGLSAIAKKTGTSPSSARQQLVKLLSDGLVVQEGKLYKAAASNPMAENISEIIRFCRMRGINYNLFLALEFAKIVRVGTSKDQVAFSEFENLNHQTVRKYLNVLSTANLVLITSRKPLVVRFVMEPIFDSVLELYGMKKEKKRISRRFEPREYLEIEQLLDKIRKSHQNIDFSETEEIRKIEFTSASTRLEGNTFTLDEARELILHDSIPSGKKMKEALEIKNFHAAVQYLINHLDSALSIPLILDIHRIVTFNLGVSEWFRTSNISIKRNPFFKISHVSEINSKLIRLCDDVNEFLSHKRSAQEVVEFATYVHNEFLHIFPFDDGNSRVTRLLWNYVLMRSGFPLINIYANAREEYLSLTKLAHERDDGRLNEFLMKVVKDNLYKMGK